MIFHCHEILKFYSNNKYLNYLKKIFIQFNIRQTIKELDLIIFLRQFSTLIASGIPILKTCDILAKTQHKPAMTSLILDIKKNILAGNTLAVTLQAYPYFDELTCQLVRIGEHTGKLNTLLLTIVDHHEKRLALKKQLYKVLFYPCVILCAAFTLILFLFIFIIPRFEELFSQHTNLPVLTRCLFSVSHVLLLLGKFFILFSLLSAVFIYYQYQNILSFLCKQLYKLPFIYSHLFNIILARFTRHLSIALGAGIPLTQALSLLSHMKDAFGFSNTVIKIRHKINTGMTLHHAIENSGHFPVLLIQMIKIGEESGTIEQMLGKVAQIFEAKTEQLLQNLMQILEPLIMAILGALIGGLVIGMYLPIFKLGNSL